MTTDPTRPAAGSTTMTVRAYLLDTLNDLWQERHLEPADSERWREADLRWQGARMVAQNVCHGLRIDWRELRQEVRDHD